MSNVISEKRQKNTLRARKGRKGTVKNVLASPYTHYWPLIKNDEDSSLKQILANNLPRIKEPKQNVPWQEIKQVPKEKRKEYRKKLSKFVSKPVDQKFMFFGINEVSRLLEGAETISAVLLSGDVTPQLMIKHIVESCVFKQVPVLIVPELKAFLKGVVGISSAAIAFGKGARCETKFRVVCETIDSIRMNYPVPETHSAYNSEGITFLTSVSNCNDTSKSSTAEDRVLKDVYLYRDSGSKRVFTPKSSDGIKQSRPDKMDIDSSGFLSFNSNVEDDGSSAAVISYRSLIVKQTKSNPDRNKRKLDTIKRNKKKKKQRTA